MAARKRSAKGKKMGHKPPRMTRSRWLKTRRGHVLRLAAIARKRRHGQYARMSPSSIQRQYVEAYKSYRGQINVLNRAKKSRNSSSVKAARGLYHTRKARLQSIGKLLAKNGGMKATRSRRRK